MKVTKPSGETEHTMSIEVTIRVPVRVKAEWHVGVDGDGCEEISRSWLAVDFASLDVELDETPSYIAGLVANELSDGVGEDKIIAEMEKIILEEAQDDPNDC